MGKCKDCKWWDLLAIGERSGECRKYAPKYLYCDIDKNSEPVASEDGIWPFTDKNDWCGEFEAR